MTFFHVMEEKGRTIRSILFRPVLHLLTFFRIRADHITFLGFLFSLTMFFCLLKGKMELALVFFLLYFFCDLLDGSLARFQKTANDKSKFFDVAVDMFAIALVAIGLQSQKLIGGMEASAFVFLSFVTPLASILLNQKKFSSDWRFKTKADPFSWIPSKLFLASFILLFFGVDIIEKLVQTLIVVLTAQFIFYSLKIWRTL